MDYKIQLLSFLASFGLGIVINFVNQLFVWYLRNKHVIIQYLLASFLALDIAMLYIAIMYRVNEGVIHVYFILMAFLGVFVGSKVNIMSIFKKFRK